MNIEVYGVGSELNPPNDLFGTASDIRTAMSLVHLARLSRCSAVYFKGTVDSGAVPRYHMTVAEAQIWLAMLELVTGARDRVPNPRTEVVW